MKTMTQMKEPKMLHNEFTIDAAYAAIDLHLLKLPARLQREDLRQDILLAVMERSVEYDPSLASWATFQDRLIEAHLENFMLSRRWKKNQSPESLDEIAEEETERVLKINDAHSWELNMQENKGANAFRDFGAHYTILKLKSFSGQSNGDCPFLQLSPRRCTHEL